MATQPKRTKITNPFYEKVLREGIHIIGEAGMRAGRTKVTNPLIRRRPGRPRKAEGSCKTTTKSLRLPDSLWQRLKAKVEREGISLHEAMRQGVLIWLQV